MVTNQDVEIDESRSAAVKAWVKRIREAREKMSNDFDRMRENMRFIAGQQWPEQDTIDSEKYSTNLTIRVVNNKTSSLYAKDPQSAFRARKRMNYQLWDGKVETLEVAVQQIAVDPLMQMPGTVEAMAVVNDYKQGRQLEEMVDKVGETLRILCEWMLAQQEPEFKTQMKQLVRRTIACGVGYVVASFERQFPATPTSDANRAVLQGKHIKRILEQLADGTLTAESEQVETLRTLLNSLQSTAQPGIPVELIVLDFPPSTSIIYDQQCRLVKGFVGARWAAQEFILPLDEVNEFFESNITVGGGDEVKLYDDSGEERVSAAENGEHRVCIWHVFDKRTQSQFYVCDGWKDYLQEPQAVEPSIHRFWPIFPLTFNDVEADACAKVSAIPPSDVQLMSHAQREHNRARESLRDHRLANRPHHLTGKGWITEGDKRNLQEREAHGVTELENVAPNTDLEKLLRPFPNAPIDPALYDTSIFQQDILLSVGMQEANLGPLSGATATEAGIAEQSRTSVSASNIDDLDEFLSDLVKAMGEMLLRAVSEETVRRVVGPGGVLPPMQNREDFVNEVFLEITAASSGRPNKAMEISNFRQMAPLLLQAGANPKYVVREAAKRLDDRANVDDAFPLVPTQSTMTPEQLPMKAPAHESKVPTQGNI
jgi:hypothetical protein